MIKLKPLIDENLFHIIKWLRNEVQRYNNSKIEWDILVGKITNQLGFDKTDKNLKRVDDFLSKNKLKRDKLPTADWLFKDLISTLEK